MALPALVHVTPQWSCWVVFAFCRTPLQGLLVLGGGCRGLGCKEHIFGIAENMFKAMRDEDSWMLYKVVLAGAQCDRASGSLLCLCCPPGHGTTRRELGWGFQPTANSVRDVPLGSSPTTGTFLATGSIKPMPKHLCPCCHRCPGQEPGCAKSPAPQPHLGMPILSVPSPRPPKASLPERAARQSPVTQQHS